MKKDAPDTSDTQAEKLIFSKEGTGNLVSAWVMRLLLKKLEKAQDSAPRIKRTGKSDPKNVI